LLEGELREGERLERELLERERLEGDFSMHSPLHITAALTFSAVLQSQSAFSQSIVKPDDVMPWMSQSHSNQSHHI
jgi:hypothetical protein